MTERPLVDRVDHPSSNQKNDLRQKDCWTSVQAIFGSFHQFRCSSPGVSGVSRGRLALGWDMVPVRANSFFSTDVPGSEVPGCAGWDRGTSSSPRFLGDRGGAVWLAALFGCCSRFCPVW